MWIVGAHMEIGVYPTSISVLGPAPEAEEPAPPPRTFLDAAEPLTAWRVDLAVLVGVVQHTVRG
jgi:hypothetical protein